MTSNLHEFYPIIHLKLFFWSFTLLYVFDSSPKYPSNLIFLLDFMFFRKLNKTGEQTEKLPFVTSKRNLSVELNTALETQQVLSTRCSMKKSLDSCEVVSFLYYSRLVVNCAMLMFFRWRKFVTRRVAVYDHIVS